MRGGLGTYILLILLVLLVFGVISLGDVLSVVLYVILGVAILVLIGGLVIRYKLYKIRKAATGNGGDFRTYTWRSGRGHERQRPRAEGEITIKGTSVMERKVVKNDIGDYVEYEEIKETIREENQ